MFSVPASASPFLPMSAGCCLLPCLALSPVHQQAASLEEPPPTNRLQSPAWNQSRPWLTGSWVMQRPQEFVQEAGGSAGQEAVLAPLMDLGLNPEAAEYLLVDDLLTVMMGQVRATAAELGGSWHRPGFFAHHAHPPCSITTRQCPSACSRWHGFRQWLVQHLLQQVAG